jgi:hypothetical protein
VVVRPVVVAIEPGTSRRGVGRTSRRGQAILSAGSHWIYRGIPEDSERLGVDMLPADENAAVEQSLAEHPRAGRRAQTRFSPAGPLSSPPKRLSLSNWPENCLITFRLCTRASYPISVVDKRAGWAVRRRLDNRSVNLSANRTARLTASRTAEIGGVIGRCTPTYASYHALKISDLEWESWQGSAA